MKKANKFLSVLLSLLLVLPFAAMNASAKTADTVHVGPSGAHRIAQFPQDMITRKAAPSHGWSVNHQRSFFGDNAWIFRAQLDDFSKVMYDAYVAAQGGLNAVDKDVEYDEEPGVIYHYRAVPINLDGFEINAPDEDTLINDELLYYAVASLSAFMEDYPEFFWITSFDFDLDYAEETDGSVTLTDFTMLLAYSDANTIDGENYGDAPYESWDDVQTAYDALIAGIDSVTVEGTTRYEKIKSIHDWICTVADYDYTFILPHCYDPLGIFADPHDFVCEGYSEIFKLLCDREGIPCITILGYGGSGEDMEGHKWNYVQMENGKWYAMDVTWDDQDLRDDDEDEIVYEYFLSGSQTYDVSFGHTTFEESHFAEGAMFNIDFYLEYPELSTEMYYDDSVYETSEDGLWRYQIVDEDESLISITSGYYGLPAYLGEDTEIEVPADIDGYTVVEIGTSAFYNFDEVTSITLPDTVESIYRFAFEGCTGIESMELPEGLVSISYGAFTNCSSLSELIIPSTLEWIGWYVFYGCESLETIVIPENVTELGDETFDTSLAAIYGYTDSYAEWYANDAGIRFIPLDADGNPTEELYNGFPDVADNAWYAEAVRYNAVRGFITGYNNGKFGPADTLKRQDFVLILARIAGVDLDAFEDETCTMPDVVAGSYYANAVKWAVENEIVTGYQNGKFGVGDNITREQVATILYRYMGEPAVSSPTKTLKPFADKDRISSFAKNAVVWAIQNGVISGKNETTLAPTATASRAEIATIVMRMDKQAMFGFPFADNSSLNP
jgi:hypothetical protein